MAHGNRFRFLLQATDLGHEMVTLLIYVSMILHNMCTICKDDAVDFTTGADDDWHAFFKEYRRDACPMCVRRASLHCPHSAKNRNAPPCKGDSAASLRDAIKVSLWNNLVDPDVRLQMGARATRILLDADE